MSKARMTGCGCSSASLTIATVVPKRSSSCSRAHLHPALLSSAAAALLRSVIHWKQRAAATLAQAAELGVPAAKEQVSQVGRGAR